MKITLSAFALIISTYALSQSYEKVSKNENFINYTKYHEISKDNFYNIMKCAKEEHKLKSIFALNFFKDSTQLIRKFPQVKWDSLRKDKSIYFNALRDAKNSQMYNCASKFNYKF